MMAGMLAGMGMLEPGKMQPKMQSKMLPLAAMPKMLAPKQWRQFGYRKALRRGGGSEGMESGGRSEE